MPTDSQLCHRHLLSDHLIRLPWSTKSSDAVRSGQGQRLGTRGTCFGPSPHSCCIEQSAAIATTIAGMGVEPNATAAAAEISENLLCISVADWTHLRLIEGVAAQLGLKPYTATLEEARTTATDRKAAMIIADEVTAQVLLELPVFSDATTDRIAPALVSVCPPGTTDTTLLPKRGGMHPYDGILILPQTPAVLLAQMSVILYAHRAHVQRFESAMEELQLNRRIFHSVNSGISVASAIQEDFPLVYVNPAFEIMTGYSLEDIEGKNCRFLQGTKRDQPGLTLLREALQAHRETVAIIQNYKKDGTPFWNELSLSPITDREGKVTHFVGIQNDVTARVAFEDALRDSEKLAAVGRLAASIAHEINNPLATITNLVYLARNEDGKSDREYLLDMAAEELTRVTLLTTQSLRFYRQSTKPTAVRPTDLVAAVLDVYSVKLRNLGIFLERRDLTCDSIVCLESEIRQVVSNLLRNAMEAMEDKPGRVLVRVRPATDWGTRLTGGLITIADTGMGMSCETKERLYTAFHTTKEQKGTGLGLWLSKEIIDRHRGRIRVRSRQGHDSGTVFQLFLPYQGVVSTGESVPA